VDIQHIFLDEPQSSNWNIPWSPTKHQIFILVIKGKVDYHMDNRTISLHAGDALFIPPCTLRSAETDPETFHSMFSIHFNDSTVEAMPFNHTFEVIQPMSYNYLKQRLSVLHECWVGKLPYFQMIAQGILNEVLGMVMRELKHSHRFSPAKRNLAHRVQHYIVQNFREPLRLSDLSKLVERTPNYISNVFKEVTSFTPVEYMHQVRIQTAQELLLNSNMTIGEISEYLGYCDQTYFNFMYKKHTGQPPSHASKRIK